MYCLQITEVLQEPYFELRYPCQVKITLNIFIKHVSFSDTNCIGTQTVNFSRNLKTDDFSDVSFFEQTDNIIY